jgi:hypothetical protein
MHLYRILDQCMLRTSGNFLQAYHVHRLDFAARPGSGPVVTEFGSSKPSRFAASELRNGTKNMIFNRRTLNFSFQISKSSSHQMSRRIRHRHCKQRRYKASSTNGENKPTATKTSENTTTPEKTGFMALPLELRLEIYQYLTEKPRIVAIYHHRKAQTYTARTSPPAILGINRDSRREDQKIYK